MSKIDKFIIDKIIETARIEEVVGDFVDLKKKGVRYLGLCPFHDDHSLGSFVVYPKGNCFKCFACDAKGGVVDFLMMHERMTYPDAIRWLGRKYHIEVDDAPFDWNPPPPRPAPPPLPMLVLPMWMVRRSETGREGNRLVVWLSSLKWDSMERSRLIDNLKAYHIGQSKQGMTIFWQIDEQQRVRTGKMMLYRPDGHRDRDTRYNFDFIHAALFRDDRQTQYSDERQEMKQCYFGLHLLNQYKVKNVEQTVCIVESEKTALIMATAYGNNAKQVWMACGGIENLTRDRLLPIIDQGRKIVLYPDRDGVERWQAKANSIGYNRILVDACPVKEWWKPCDGEKADIADIVLRYIQERKQLKTIDEVKREMPQAAILIDKLNLVLEDDKKTT